MHRTPTLKQTTTTITKKCDKNGKVKMEFLRMDKFKKKAAQKKKKRQQYVAAMVSAAASFPLKLRLSNSVFLHNQKKKKEKFERS